MAGMPIERLDCLVVARRQTYRQNKVIQTDWQLGLMVLVARDGRNHYERNNISHKNCHYFYASVMTQFLPCKNHYIVREYTKLFLIHR